MKIKTIPIIAIFLFLITLIFFALNNPFKKELLVQFNFIEARSYTVWDMEEDVIKTSIKDNDRILIDVYKTVALGEYKGNCKMRVDTLILNYWEEMDEKLKNEPRLALAIPVQFQYEIRAVKYKNIKVEQLPIKYIEK
jgi:hypothetical protein